MYCYCYWQLFDVVYLVLSEFYLDFVCEKFCFVVRFVFFELCLKFNMKIWDGWKICKFVFY